MVDLCLGEYSQKCMTFTYSQPEDEQVAGEAVVLNALEKAGIRLPRYSTANLT